MNKDDGKRLIQDTLQNTFSKERFVYFVKNLLNDYDESKAFHAHGYVLEIYRNFVKTYERLGTYTDPIGKKIDIIIVYLQKETSIDKARTAQRNFIAQYLKDRGEKDAGLIAFVSPNLEDWRFSFVKMEYRFEETKDGKIKAKESFTPAKRYSFLVGPHEASHTAQSRMLPVILNDTINPTLDEIEDIFSVEKVTKEFFEQYKKLFLNLADEFTGNKEFENKVVKEHGIQVADFVKKLMGQIVFLYFLQKKGWLGVKSGERWGMGDKRFMHNLFDRQYCEYENYFNDVLEPLFYDTLNKRDRGNSSVTNDQSYSPHFKCRIPYLNGGLFTPVYDWQRTKIYIDNKYFHDIFEVFDTFNFTVFESDPIEKEVAVDPEMLGKVFENLLEVRDRKSKGAFYTPREIVHYMCQESLINYLISQSGFPEVRIRNLMKAKDQGIGRTEKQIEFIENSSELKEIATKVNALLKEVKICDPAVGSGAFPMGLLKEISTTRFFLNKHFLKEKNKFGYLLTEYDIKKETLENCIYGVDIDPGAVEIARLRFWLSLVVEHDIEEIEPLPNLDYKIMQGNSLIELLSPNLLAKTNDDNRNKIIDQLTIAKTGYFSLSDSLSKSRKREEINLLVRHIVNYDKEKQRGNIWEKIKDIRSQMGLFTDKKITEQLNIGDVTSKEITKEFKELNRIENVSNAEHFEWHLNFNEIFEKGGFNIIIANPPYLKERDNKKVFEEINKSDFGQKYHQGKMDLWFYFLHKAIDVVNTGGVIAFITSRYWLNSMGAKKLIDRVRKELSFVNFIDIGKLKVFDEVAGQHMVGIYKKSKDNDSFIYKKLNNNIEDISKNINTDNIVIKTLSNNKVITSNSEIILDSDTFETDNCELLGDVTDISQGVVEASDKVSKKMINNISKSNIRVGDGIFVLTKNELESLTLSESELSCIKKYVDPNNIFPFHIKWNNKYLIYSDGNIRNEIKNNPNFIRIKQHLDKYKNFITSSNKPYGLHRSRDIKYFINPKIIFKGMFTKNCFAYDEDNYFAGFSFSLIISKDSKYDLKYILSILNSKFALYWFYKNGKKRGAGVDIGVQKLRQFPIKYLSLQEQNKYINLVDLITLIYKNKDNLENKEQLNVANKYLDQINQMVYKLYGLTPAEVEIMEKVSN